LAVFDRKHSKLLLDAEEASEQTNTHVTVLTIE